MGNKPRVKPNCQECGACCIAPYQQDTFCDVTEEDVKRLPTALHRHVRYDSPLALFVKTAEGDTNYMSLATKELTTTKGRLKDVEANACVFLDGDLMSCVTCRVYEQRPSICRTAIQPGDRNCRAIRSQLLVIV